MYLLDVQCSSVITDLYNAGSLTLMGVDDATWLDQCNDDVKK